MAQKLTERQEEVLKHIIEQIRDTGMSPTRAELAQIMGFQSKNAANDHLKALARKGYIQLHAERSRGIQLLVDPYASENMTPSYELPLIGSVAAGVPIEAIEHVERKVSVPEDLFSSRPTYLLKVRGDSMRDAGILDGDLIAVRKTEVARHGQIIVARINDEVTVKELKLCSKALIKVIFFTGETSVFHFIISKNQLASVKMSTNSKNSILAENKSESRSFSSVNDSSWLCSNF